MGRPAGSFDADGYVQFAYRGKKYKAHRVAWVYVHGHLPDDTEIDHRNHDRADNRIDNLRLATRKQNSENTRSRRAGHFRGVSWWTTPRGNSYWVARIKHHGTAKTLGYFHTIVDAVAARLRAERQMFSHAPSNA